MKYQLNVNYAFYNLELILQQVTTSQLEHKLELFETKITGKFRAHQLIRRNDGFGALVLIKVLLRLGQLALICLSNPARCPPMLLFAQ